MTNRFLSHYHKCINILFAGKLYDVEVLFFTYIEFPCLSDVFFSLSNVTPFFLNKLESIVDVGIRIGDTRGLIWVPFGVKAYSVYKIKVIFYLCIVDIKFSYLFNIFNLFIF